MEARSCSDCQFHGLIVNTNILICKAAKYITLPFWLEGFTDNMYIKVFDTDASRCRKFNSTKACDD